MDRTTVADNTIKSVTNTLMYISEMGNAATTDGDRSFLAALSTPLRAALEEIERQAATSA